MILSSTSWILICIRLFNVSLILKLNLDQHIFNKYNMEVFTYHFYCLSVMASIFKHTTAQTQFWLFRLEYKESFNEDNKVIIVVEESSKIPISRCWLLKLILNWSQSSSYTIVST